MSAFARCPLCGATNELLGCPTCNQVYYKFDRSADGRESLECQSCGERWSHFLCMRCKHPIPVALFVSGQPQKSAADMPNWARGVQAGLGGPCFIATELYGQDSLEVMTLRHLRDEILLRNVLGRNLVTLYYALSPRLIPAIRQSRTIRSLFGKLVELAVSMADRRLRNRG
jgi:hypothetical protein